MLWSKYLKTRKDPDFIVKQVGRIIMEVFHAYLKNILAIDGIRSQFY